MKAVFQTNIDISTNNLHAVSSVADGKCVVRNHLQARIHENTGFHRFKEIGQIFHYNYILSKKL